VSKTDTTKEVEQVLVKNTNITQRPQEQKTNQSGNLPISQQDASPLLKHYGIRK